MVFNIFSQRNRQLLKVPKGISILCTRRPLALLNSMLMTLSKTFKMIYSTSNLLHVWAEITTEGQRSNWDNTAPVGTRPLLRVLAVQPRAHSNVENILRYFYMLQSMTWNFRAIFWLSAAPKYSKLCPSYDKNNEDGKRRWGTSSCRLHT